jgi:hypothetical protein
VAPRKIPARLDVFLAPKARKAVVLRRGPAKLVCMAGWDLSNDTFELGQWVKGRIHGYCCDLSLEGGGRNDWWGIVFIRHEVLVEQPM